MAREVVIAPDRTKLLITLRVDGKVTNQDRIDPGSSRARRSVCAAMNLEDKDLLAWTGEVRASGTEKTFTLAEPVLPMGEAYVVRGMTQARSEGVRHDMYASQFVKQVLPAVPLASVAEWDDVESLCCLDVDYHDSVPPDREWLRTIVLTSIAPKPIAWHFSKSGGLHLFYTEATPFRANELAAVAALRFRAIDSVAGLELKTVVRGPGTEPVLHTVEQDTGGAVLGDWFGAEGTDDDARDEWLERAEMQIDSRYDHTKCPIAPSEDEPGAKRNPVCVNEGGVYCFICESKGRSLGCRRAGFAPWSAILGAPSSGDLGTMVRGLCHWGHARWVLTERYGMPEKLARLAYTAALRAKHGGTPREHLIGRVFDQNTDRIARSGVQWYNIAESVALPKDILPMLACLPAALNVDADGKVTVNQAAVCELNQTYSLVPRGYPSIERIHGFRIAGVHQMPPRTQVSVINPELSVRHRPRYRIKSERMPMDEAWSLIESVFPRLDRTLVQLILCSFGSAQETRAGMPPFMFLSGVSAAGKTTHAKIAAAIYGTKIAEAVFDPDTTRFRQNLFDGAQKGPVVVINELLKDAGRRDRLTSRQALDPLLNLTHDSQSHVLYRGPVQFGRVPAVIVTEVECPLALRDEKQIARRIRHHRVEGGKEDWRKAMGDARLRDPHALREVSDKVNTACDAVLSAVCDDYFGVPLSWDEQADMLGVRTLDSDANFDDTTPQLLEFFRLVCGAEKLTDKMEKRLGRGFKKISRHQQNAPDGEEDDLVALYSMFADGTGTEWLHSRRLQEKDWSALLGSGVPVRLDQKNDGASVYVRFRVGPIPPTAVNGEIECKFLNKPSTPSAV